MLTEYLARGLARALSIPEGRVKIFKRKGTRQPDVQIIDAFGVRAIVQGKIGNLEKAIEDCIDVLEKDLADICFAASYPRTLAELGDAAAVRDELERSLLEIALVTPPRQLALQGWPVDSVRRLGSVTPEQLMEMLQSEALYDEIIGTEAAESVAENVTDALDELKALPDLTVKAVHKNLSEALRVVLETKAPREDEEDAEE